MTFQNSQVRFYVSLIGSGEGRHTTHLLKCVLLLLTSQTDWKQSNVLSDISCDILSVISSDISSGILSSQDRSRGPARNTDVTGSRLRSSNIAVEVRRDDLPGSPLRSGAQH